MPRKIFLHENLGFVKKPKGNYVELNTYVEASFERNWLSEQSIALPKAAFRAYSPDQLLERLAVPAKWLDPVNDYDCIKSWRAKAIGGDEDGTAHVCLKVGDDIFEDIIVTKEWVEVDVSIPYSGEFITAVVISPLNGSLYGLDVEIEFCETCPGKTVQWYVPKGTTTSLPMVTGVPTTCAALTDLIRETYPGAAFAFTTSTHTGSAIFDTQFFDLGEPFNSLFNDFQTITPTMGFVLNTTGIPSITLEFTGNSLAINDPIETDSYTTGDVYRTVRQLFNAGAVVSTVVNTENAMGHLYYYDSVLTENADNSAFVDQSFSYRLSVPFTDDILYHFSPIVELTKVQLYLPGDSELLISGQLYSDNGVVKIKS